MLLDEPLSNLDAKLRRSMRREIREIQRSLGMTMLYVTHDREEAEEISDRMAVHDRRPPGAGRGAGRDPLAAGRRGGQGVLFGVVGQ